jgi:hypothetical protein
MNGKGGTDGISSSRSRDMFEPGFIATDLSAQESADAVADIFFR